MAESRPFSEELKRFTSEERWTYAKTMPAWPHEYLVRERVNDEPFEHLVEHIRANGYDGRFYQRQIRYYEEGGWVYWTMGAPLDETTIINRCRKENTFEYRAAHGTLPDRIE
jgi:hypothetical protein